MKKAVHSMTGFASVETESAGQRLRMEIKALNHRFLDVKIRMPREWSLAEAPLRAAVQAAFSRGSIEVKIERAQDLEVPVQGAQLNFSLAAHYYESLVNLQRALGLTDPIRTSDIIALPEVFGKQSNELKTEEAWQNLESLAQSAITGLTEMRAHEGAALYKVLQNSLKDLDRNIDHLRGRREELQKIFSSRLTEKIKAVFEIFPVTNATIESVLESRIAQEMSLLLEKSDIEEELIRFKNHLEHFKKTLDSGGPVGRKLEFILQELHREINTLSNKAQDFSINEQAIEMKVVIEQLREQVMNLE